MRPHPPARTRAVAAALALAALAAPVPVRAADPDAPVPVRVEAARPRREALPTLRFLRTNLDFFRARLDRLRERALAERGSAQPIDPRFLAYRDLLASVRAAGDSVAAAADADQRRVLFASVTDLGQLERELDGVDRLLAAQRARLGALQADFAGQQRTALAVLVSGGARGDLPPALALVFDDGTRVDVPLPSEQRAALAAGGVLEVFHGLIEPREQVFAVALARADGASADSAFVTLTPEPDRLTFLRLDLAGAPAGAAGLTATTWRHADAPEPAPRP